MCRLSIVTWAARARESRGRRGPRRVVESMVGFFFGFGKMVDGDTNEGFDMEKGLWEG